MKHFILISLTVFILISCFKNDDNIFQEDRLVGFWLLTDVTGGISGAGYEANFDHLQINEGERYSLMVNDSYIQEGSFVLNEDGDQLNIQFIPDMIDTIFFDEHLKSVLFTAQDKKLTLTDPCCDLFVYHFNKEE